jgi:adenylate cyclase
MQTLEQRNAARMAAGAPTIAAGAPSIKVDLALHLGEVLYRNVGASDRLDFTVIGPAANAVARIEALCEPLGRKVLASAEFAAAAGSHLESVGYHNLRGIKEATEFFALT